MISRDSKIEGKHLTDEDKYFKEPKYFYRIFDENTWLEKKELSSKLYFHHFRKTSNKGDLDERLISDKNSFQSFLNNNKIIGVCSSNKYPGSSLKFFSSIKILKIFDDYLEIKFSKPKFVKQYISYEDHKKPENFRIFFQELSTSDLNLRDTTADNINELDRRDWEGDLGWVVNDSGMLRYLARTDLSFSILSVHKSKSITLTEIEKYFRERCVIEEAIDYKRKKILSKNKYKNLSFVEKACFQDCELEEFKKEVMEGYISIEELVGVRLTEYVLPNDKDLEEIHNKAAQDFYNLTK